MPSFYGGPTTATPKSTVKPWWETSAGSSGGSVAAPDVGGGSTGVYSLDVSNPAGLQGSLQQNDKQTGDFIAGLGEALFGEKTGLVSSIPVIGGPVSSVVRGISSIPGVGIPAAALSGAFGAAGTVLSRIPTGWLPGGVDENFNALPDSPEKQAVAQAANADVLNGANIKYDYLQKLAASQPNLFPDLSTGPAGSLGGLGVQLLNVLGIPQRLVERGIAGAGRPGNAGLNQLQMIQAVASGQAVWTTGSSGLTEVEQTAYDNVRTGKWTEAQALDWLASHGAGLSHDQLTEIAGSFATDPTLAAGLISGGVSLAAKGARAATEAGLQASRIGTAALAAQESSLGPLFRGARTVIDPLSQLNKFSHMPPQVIDALAADNRWKSAGLAFGGGNLVGVRNWADKAGLTTDVFGDASGALDNIVREFTGNHIANTLKPVIAGVTPGALNQLPAPADIEAIARKMEPVTYDDYLKHLTNVRARNVDEGDLAQRLAIAYGGDPASYADAVKDMNDDMRAFLHLATYNKAENRLMQAVARSQQVPDGLPIERLVLHNPRSLDELAAGTLRKQFIDAMTEDKSTMQQVIKDALDKYDNLASVVKLNPADPKGTLERAVEKIDMLINQQELPRVVKASELAQYPEIAAWAGSHKPWGLAFRPPDEALWRAVYDTEGELAFLNPWIGHAPNDGKSLYRPGFNLPRNLVGQPVVDAAFSKIQKPLDWLTVGQGALRTQVSGAVVKANAHGRFVANAERLHGLSRTEAEEWWQALEKATGMSEWSQSVRGMSRESMWKAITDANLLPRRLMSGPRRLTKRDMANLVLDAFEGDLRYVGLTQKFTGRMKTLLGTKGPLQDFAGGNFAGQLSERFYPAARFVFRPFFQAQESVEGVVLNAQRGVTPSLTGKLTEADKAIARLMQNLQDSGLVRLFESGDQAEYSVLSQLGGRLQKLAADLPNAGIRLGEEGGLKFIAKQKYVNYLRLWRSKLGELRDVMGEERFLALKRHYAVADDSEVMVRYLSEMFSENADVAFRPNGFLDFERLISNADMYKPMALGELKPLNLDYVARTAGYDHMGGLREALDNGHESIDSIVRQMRDQYPNVSDEYLHRMSLALKFDVRDFWANVKDAYHLTDEEARAIRTVFDNSARMRGLSPVEYLSNVLAPTVKKVEAGKAAGEVIGHVDIAAIKNPLHRQASIEELHDIMLQMGGYGDKEITQRFFANTPDLAIGQGGNTGVKFVYDQDAIKTAGSIAPDLSKPGMAFSAGAGGGGSEFVAENVKTSEYAAGLRKIEIAPDAMARGIRVPSGFVRSAFKQRFETEWTALLAKNGWKKEVLADGTMVFTAPVRSEVATGLHKAQEIKDTVALLRAPKGRVSGSQADTLYSELAAAFKPHLDPSGVDVLRKASGIKGRWGAKHNEWLGQQMKAYIEGTATNLDPDVERALQFMGKWTNGAAGELAVGSPELRAIIAQTSKMNTAAGVPYNFTEHLAWQAVVDRMRSFEQDAYRVHYFKRARTVFERSVNHPFFGLYPASYMWGKILPEMVRFVALEPFGIPTGALAYGINDIYKTVAMQNEFDPDFRKKLDDIGHAPATFMLGYMLPAVPWDVPAVLPQWARELANQGLANKQRRDAGLATKNIDSGAALQRVADYVNPLPTDIERQNSTLAQVGNVVLGSPKEQAQRGGPQVSIGPLTLGGSVNSLTPLVGDSIQKLQDELFKGKFD